MPPKPQQAAISLNPQSSLTSPPHAVLAQEEIFGPVLALIKVDSFEQGLQVANNTEYGLTGSVYTADRARIGHARAGVPRRQPLFQSQVHGRDGRRASLRRLQHERHGLKGRRPGLFDPVHPGQERGGGAARGGCSMIAHTNSTDVISSGRLLGARLYAAAVGTACSSDSSLLPISAAACASTRWWMVNSASSRRSLTPVLS